MCVPFCLGALHGAATSPPTHDYHHKMLQSNVAMLPFFSTSRTTTLGVYDFGGLSSEKLGHEICNAETHASGLRPGVRDMPGTLALTSVVFWWNSRAVIVIFCTMVSGCFGDIVCQESGYVRNMCESGLQGPAFYPVSAELTGVT